MATSNDDNGNKFEVVLTRRQKWEMKHKREASSSQQDSSEASHSTSTNPNHAPRHRPSSTTASDADTVYTHPSCMGQPGDALSMKIRWCAPRDGTAHDDRDSNTSTPSSVEPISHHDTDSLSVPQDDTQSDTAAPSNPSYHQSNPDHLTILSDALSASRKEGGNCTLDKMGTDALQEALEEIRRFRFLAYIGDYVAEVHRGLRAINKHLHNRRLGKLSNESELDKYDVWIKAGKPRPLPSRYISDIDTCISNPEFGHDVLSHEGAYLAFKLYTQRNAEFHSGLGSYEAKEHEDRRTEVINRDLERLPWVVPSEYASVQGHLWKVIDFSSRARSIYDSLGVAVPK
ncbi:hypothetical protein BJY00DRAFT_317519 [Aspergillus carlsbadensis]|nr:hypothetical protein BJY00DRAFT_317519 [Aspergillus carlsbadensis]